MQKSLPACLPTYLPKFVIVFGFQKFMMCLEMDLFFLFRVCSASYYILSEHTLSETEKFEAFLFSPLILGLEPREWGVISPPLFKNSETVSLNCPGWPWTCNSPASTCQKLGLQVCTVTLVQSYYFFKYRLNDIFLLSSWDTDNTNVRTFKNRPTDQWQSLF